MSLQKSLCRVSFTNIGFLFCISIHIIVFVISETSNFYTIHSIEPERVSLNKSIHACYILPCIYVNNLCENIFQMFIMYYILINNNDVKIIVVSTLALATNTIKWFLVHGFIWITPLRPLARLYYIIILVMSIFVM